MPMCIATPATRSPKRILCALFPANAVAAGNDEGAFSLFDLDSGTELYRQIIGGGT